MKNNVLEFNNKFKQLQFNKLSEHCLKLKNSYIC